MAGAQGLVQIPELRKKLFFVLIMLAVYRLGVYVPVPGIDQEGMKLLFENMKGSVFGIFNMFSGGALEKFSIFALGIMPYISSSIIFQLLTVVSPYLAELQKEGEQGRKKITQYTRYGTVLLCIVQGFGLASFMQAQNNPQVVLDQGMTFKIMTILTLTTGTMFLMWLGEQMTERGIGNGTSLIIYAGIAASILPGASNTFSLLRRGAMSFPILLAVLAVIIATFYIIIFIERGARKVPVHYAKRVVGRKVYGGQNTHLPLKVNVSGVIPPIFASSILMFPATLGTMFTAQNQATSVIGNIAQQLMPGTLLHDVVFVAFIIFFCFFYTAVVFKTDDVADNLKKYGGFIPGIRPGQPTADYLDFVLSRITLGGAIYIAAICVLPTMLTTQFKVPFYFGGTSVLILVGVALDFVAQVQTFLISRNYEGFMKHTKVQGRTAYS